MDYALWVSFWSVIGAVLGLHGANIYMKKFKRQSIIVFFLALVLGLSVIGVPYFGIKDIVRAEENGFDFYGFKSLCK